jgi:uncharacterized protein YdaU (DUF1376 family)
MSAAGSPISRESKMAEPKVRRVDHYPADWLADAIELTLEERGMHDTACNLIYSRGGPIDPDHLRRACSCHGRMFDRLLARLIDLDKLFITDDGKINQKRCQTELKNARKRIETSRENGKKGGRGSRENKRIAEPTGSSRAREGVAKTTIINSEKKGKANDDPGRSAPPESAVDHAAAVVGQAVRALTPKRVRDPAAYDAAVEGTIWNAWLDRITRFVMPTFTGQAMLDALEAVETARAAGSREQTPSEIRKVINELDKLERADRSKDRSAA